MPERSELEREAAHHPVHARLGGPVPDRSGDRGHRPVADETITMRPHPRSIMPGTIGRVTL